MLNPNEDRLDYGQLLTPPDGYSLDLAVGTTYSLDLDALTGACLSLGLSAETGSELATENPVCLLEGLRLTGSKIALFCEAGQIHVPKKGKALYAFLESMIFQVALGRVHGVRGYPAFHPKLWVIRYISEATKEKLYRIIVLSRNLTFDRSWDVSFCMDGRPAKEQNEKNFPLSDLLHWLSGWTGASPKKQAIRGLASEIQYVRFQTNSRDFPDFKFLPTGIPGRNGRYDIRNDELFTVKKFEELFIISPFLSKTTIRDFNNRVRSTNNYLVTRAMSLDKLNADDCSKFKVYLLQDAVAMAEDAGNDETERRANQDIHAKVYLTYRARDTELYIGSLNASEKANSANVEFMVRLHSTYQHINREMLARDLMLGDAGSPFLPATVTEKENDVSDDPTAALEQTIKEIIRCDMSGTVSEGTVGYDLTVHVNKLPVTEYTISIAPLLANIRQTLCEETVFSSIPLEQLTEFFVLTVADCAGNSVSRVIRISISNVPETRDDRIISDVIRDRPQFYRYILLLLGDDFFAGTMEADTFEREFLSGSKSESAVLPGLYEKMLEAAVNRPERFSEIGKLLKALGNRDAIPEHFAELYETFGKVVKQNG